MFGYDTADQGLWRGRLPGIKYTWEAQCIYN